MAAKRRKSSSRGRTNRGQQTGVGRYVARTALWIGAMVLVAAILVLAAIGLQRVLFTQNDHFRIEHLRTVPTRHMPEDRLRRILADADVFIGRTNLFAFSPEVVRERIEREVMVARADVFRRLPDTLEVHIQERRPVARLHVTPAKFIDADGVLLPWSDAPETRLLPDIVGVRNPQNLREGRRPADPVLLGALTFLRAIATRPEAVTYYDVHLVELDYTQDALEVHLHERKTFIEGAVVKVPIKNMDAALDRLHEIARHRSDTGARTAHVDVTYEVNVPVRPN